MTRRDRYGDELLEADDVAPQPTSSTLDHATGSARDGVAHGCVGGWLGDDEHGRPIACSTCKPHLAAARARVDAAIHGPVARWSE